MLSVSLSNQLHGLTASLEDIKDAEQEFKECRALDTVSISPRIHRAFGFEVTWRARDSPSSTQQRLCNYAVSLQNMSSTGVFAATIDKLEPATTYILSIRAFFVYFEPNPVANLFDLSYVFGPSSREVVIVTADDVPQGAPLNLHVNSTSDTEIRVSYDPPAEDVRHGEIELYQAEIWELSSTSDFDSTTVAVSAGATLRRRTTSEDEQIGFDRLKPDTIHAIRVRAKTSALGYSNWTHEINVSTCPSDMKRVFADSNSDAECYARTGFYKTPQGNARSCGGLAERLFPGALEGTCEDEFFTVENLSIAGPFWRSSLSSADIRQCPNTLFCSGAGSTNSSRESPDQYCSEAHTGIYCWGCIQGYALASSGCVDCSTMSQSDKNGVVAAAVIIVVVVAVVLLVYMLWTARSGQRTRPVRRKDQGGNRQGLFVSLIRRGSSTTQNVLTLWWPLVSTKIRIMLGYFQVLLSFQRTFQRYTVSNNTLFNVINVISSLRLADAIETIALRCVYDYDYYDILLFMTLMPLALIAMLGSVCGIMCWTCLRKREERKKALVNAFGSVTLLLLFLIYPSTSETIFATFWCEDFPKADRTKGLTSSALRSDYRVSCVAEDDPRRVSYVAYASFMILVYPVGIVAVYAGILWSIRKLVLKDRAGLATAEELQRLKQGSFLTRPYKAEAFWYEAYELIRKLCQTSLVGFLQGLNLENVSMVVFLPLIELNLCIVFVVLLVFIQPYRNGGDFAFAVLSLFMLMPATQLSILDPYTRADWALLGLEVLVYLEIAFFGLFVLFEAYAVRRGWHTDEHCPVDETPDSQNVPTINGSPSAEAVRQVEMPSSFVAPPSKEESEGMGTLSQTSNEDLKRQEEEVMRLKALLDEREAKAAESRIQNV